MNQDSIKLTIVLNQAPVLDLIGFVTQINSFKRPLITMTSSEWKTQLDRKSNMFIEDVTSVLRSHYTDNREKYDRTNSSPVINSASDKTLASSERRPINVFQAFCINHNQRYDNTNPINYGCEGRTHF
jgi:hypothetical protein